MRYLSFLALMPMLIGPAIANPPCVTCAPRVRTVVKIKRIIDPVAVFVPSYVATIAPYAVAAPTYPAQPAALPAPVAQAAPVYPQLPAVQYGAPVIAQQQYAAVQPQQDQLALALQQINQRLCTLEDKLKFRSENPQLQQPPSMPRGEALAPTGQPKGFIKCATCHSDATAKGNFKMFEAGKLAALTDKQWKRVLVNCYSGTMPPKDSNSPPLTDDEVAEIVNFVSTQK